MTQTTLSAQSKLPKDISSFTLHLLAMGLMLCDHMWATIIPGHQWLTWLGRLAYPIFAFLIVEGYFHTSNFKKYIGRLFLFALISEIPFNLMYTASWIYPFHQNVLWTFLLALWCIRSIDKLRTRFKPWISLPLAALLAGLFMLLGQFTMVDYYGYGVLMVILFYFCRGQGFLPKLGQLAGMIYINWFMVKGLTIPISLFGFSFDLPQQGIAVLALLPIWLYKGRQGYRSKPMQYFFYAFYPVHMLILGLLSM